MPVLLLINLLVVTFKDALIIDKIDLVSKELLIKVFFRLFISVCLVLLTCSIHKDIIIIKVVIFLIIICFLFSNIRLTIILRLLRRIIRIKHRLEFKIILSAVVVAILAISSDNVLFLNQV